MSDEFIVPKWWRNAITIPPQYGPLAGELARPCACGRPTDVDDGVHLVRWYDGTLMFAHEECVGSPDNA